VRGPAFLATITLLFCASARAATPGCDARAGEMREQLQHSSKHLTGPIEVPSRGADWVRDLVRRYEAEKDPAKRSLLIAGAWPKAFGTCPAPFGHAFSGAAPLDPAAKVAHLQRALPEALVTCNCTGADADAIEVVMAMAVRDIMREQNQHDAEVDRAAAPKKVEDVIRKGGSLYRLLVETGQPPRCTRERFRHGKSPLSGRLGAFDYQYADGTFTLNGPKGKSIGLGCFFNARVSSAGTPDAVLIDHEKVYLTPAACEAARKAPPAPVKHLCPW
jgi:hypothetical protein